LDKLGPKEKEFLNSFLSETVITNFEHKGKKLYKSKKKKREMYSENNARNRCMLSKAKATGLLLKTTDASALAAAIDEQVNTSINHTEEAMIDILDYVRNNDDLED